MAEHMLALQEYAQRVFLEEDALTAEEDDDKTSRMRDFMSLGTALGCTKAELVTLLYEGLFRMKRGCDCPPCQSGRRPPSDPQG